MAYKGNMIFYHEQWPVFYEDNHLLVVYKPAGLIMQRDQRGKANLLDMAKSWLKQRYAKPGNVFVGMVHRLDGPVAGIVVLARTSKAASRLSAQFRGRCVEKRYLAVVSGRPPRTKDRLVHWLVRDGRLSRVAVQGDHGAQKAVLRYVLQTHKKRQGLLAVHLETGRRHQIRVQLAAIGCPILGDRRYGADKGLAHGRIALLAHRLTFDHPTRRNRLQFESTLPRGWPLPHDGSGRQGPHWTIEEYLHHGLVLPSDSI